MAAESATEIRIERGPAQCALGGRTRGQVFSQERANVLADLLAARRKDSVVRSEALASWSYTILRSRAGERLATLNGWARCSNSNSTAWRASSELKQVPRWQERREWEAPQAVVGVTRRWVLA